MNDTQDGTIRIRLPLFLSLLHAGFPSPADDYIERSLDLNELVIHHPEATFFVQVTGDSMIQASIWEGDIVVVDRAVKAQHNSIVVAIVNGEFTVKRFHRKGESMYLLPENPQYKPIQITEEMEFEVWGVVTHCLHKVR